MSSDILSPIPDFEGGNPRYDIDWNIQRRMAGELIEERPMPDAGRFVLHKLSGLDERSNIGRSVELEVFKKRFGNDVSDMQREYGPYESQSDMFVVLDREAVRPVGALRVISNGAAGLKTLNDIGKPPLDISMETFKTTHDVAELDKTLDIGTVAVLPEYRKLGKHVVSSMLYRAMYTSSVNEGFEHYVSVIDEPVYQNFRKVGFPFVPIAGSEAFSYIGSEESRAVYGKTSEFKPSAYKKLAKNIITAPHIAGFALQHVLRLTTGMGIDKSIAID